MAKLTEGQVAKNMMAALQAEGWDVYPEVAVGRLLERKIQMRTGRSFGDSVADLVAVKGPLAMIVEAKLTFSLQVIEQALEWTRLSPLVAIALPYKAMTRPNELKLHIRDHYGVGVFCVSDSSFKPSFRPRLHRHNLPFVDDLAGILTEEMKLADPGEKNTWRRTPYQDTMIHVRIYLAAHGPCPMNDIFDYLEGSERRHHYAHAASMKGSLRKSFYAPDIEPDISVGADNQVYWDPDKCTKNERYVAHIVDASKRLKSKKKTKSKVKPKKAEDAEPSEPELEFVAPGM